MFRAGLSGIRAASCPHKTNSHCLSPPGRASAPCKARRTPPWPGGFGQSQATCLSLPDRGNPQRSITARRGSGRYEACRECTRQTTPRPGPQEPRGAPPRGKAGTGPPYPAARRVRRAGRTTHVAGSGRSAPCALSRALRGRPRQARCRHRRQSRPRSRHSSAPLGRCAPKRACSFPLRSALPAAVAGPLPTGASREVQPATRTGARVRHRRGPGGRARDPESDART